MNERKKRYDNLYNRRLLAEHAMIPPRPGVLWELSQTSSMHRAINSLLHRPESLVYRQFRTLLEISGIEIPTLEVPRTVTLDDRFSNLMSSNGFSANKLDPERPNSSNDEPSGGVLVPC